VWPTIFLYCCFIQLYNLFDVGSLYAIKLYKVSLQGTGSEPRGLGPSALSKIVIRLLASLGQKLELSCLSQNAGSYFVVKYCRNRVKRNHLEILSLCIGRFCEIVTKRCQIDPQK